MDDDFTLCDSPEEEAEMQKERIKEEALFEEKHLKHLKSQVYNAKIRLRIAEKNLENFEREKQSGIGHNSLEDL